MRGCTNLKKVLYIEGSFFVGHPKTESGSNKMRQSVIWSKILFRAPADFQKLARDKFN